MLWAPSTRAQARWQRITLLASGQRPCLEWSPVHQNRPKTVAKQSWNSRKTVKINRKPHGNVKDGSASCRSDTVCKFIILNIQFLVLNATIPRFYSPSAASTNSSVSLARRLFSPAVLSRYTLLLPAAGAISKYTRSGIVNSSEGRALCRVLSSPSVANLQNYSFWIQNSSFLIQNSSFLIQNSSFLIQNSSFVIHSASFLMQNSSFLLTSPAAVG